MVGIDFEPVREKIHGATLGIRAKLNPVSPDLGNPQPKQTFKSVAVIGAAGQVGGLFTETLSLARGVKVDPVLRGGIGSALEREPEVVILATPNPTTEALEDISKHIKKPLTLVLPQNGVEVVLTAEKVLGEFRSQITIVRASLFTNVSRDKEGKIQYNKKKKRIGLASVDQDEGALQQTVSLFRGAGFEVAVVDDYKSMEYTKLIANLLGSSSTVTGLSPKETFSDRQLFDLELRALKDRMVIFKEAGIEFADIEWAKKLKILARVPRTAGRVPWVRSVIAGMVAAERNNQPSSAARQIEAGARKVEPTDSYHRPFTRLAHDLKVEISVDESVVDILVRHEKGANPKRVKFDLGSLSDAEKRALLLEVYGYESQDVFIKRASFLGIPYARLALERVYEWFVDKFTVLGKENLKPVLETLRSGQSVIVAPNHRSHGDHTTVIKALRESLPFGTIRKYPIYVIAGMKFDKEDISGRFNKAYSHPVVWTLTEADVENEDIRWRAQMINGRSVLKIKEILAKKKKPCILVVYFEGGRNKEGLDVQEPVVGGGIWLLNPNVGLVVPTFIDGTQILLPPGAQKPQHADVTIEFLEAIKTAKFREEEATTDHRGRDMHFSREVLSRVSERQRQ